MIEARRYCPEILVQTRAAASALGSIERTILEKHLRRCVSEVLSTPTRKHAEKKVEELIELLARF